MGDWVPLHARDEQTSDSYEGVPAHLELPLLTWLSSALEYSPVGDWLIDVASAARIPASSNTAGTALAGEILNIAGQSSVHMLNTIDALLQFSPHGPDLAPALERRLRVGGSVWTVALGGRSLQRRADPSVVRMTAYAAGPLDRASSELQQAWAKTFGRSPDPSDAWDHAIKAVEAVLIPVVVPKKDKSNLGDVLGQLKGQPELWTAQLESSSSIGAVQTVEAMIRLIWPNPDRHAGGSGGRSPSLREAEAVVYIASTLVALCRSSFIARASQKISGSRRSGEDQ